MLICNLELVQNAHRTIPDLLDMCAEFWVEIVAMTTEKSGEEFPPQPVEVVHLGDTHVKTPEPVKLEDLVASNDNPFTPLESRPSSKEGIEASMKSLSMTVSICSNYY